MNSRHRFKNTAPAIIRSAVGLSLCASALLAAHTSYAEVQELSNTEMTEAYIEDGGIVVKQKAKEKVRAQQNAGVKARLNVRPGEPHITDAEVTRDRESQYQNSSDALLVEMQRDTTQQQLEQNQLNQHNSAVMIPELQSEAALAQRAHAEDIVRNAMGLSAETQVTDVMMAQYLSSFNGQSSGTIQTFQHNATNTGFQFIIPNAGNINPGIHNSGDGSLNVEVTNQQIIWNFVYPTE